MIAKVAVDAANFAIDKPYSYQIPREMELKPGMRVQIPFGRSNRRTEGVVLSVEEGDQDQLKPIDCSLDESPVLSETMLRLAAFMRERYFCTFYDAIRTMLPGGLWFRTRETVTLTDDRSWQEKPLRNQDAYSILQYLLQCIEPVREDVLRQVVSDESDFEKAMAFLLRKKWIATKIDYLRRTRDKTEQVVSIAVPSEEILAFAESRPKSAVMQRSVLELMCSVGTASVKDVCYYTGALPATVKRLARLGYLALSEKPVLRCREIKPATLSGPLVLNEEQKQVFDGLAEQLNSSEPGVALLHGITGSGKTAVYVKLIQRCIDQGKQAVLLVPEIALTPQLLGMMAAYFDSKVAVLHSSLPATERFDQWKRVKSGEAKVVVGTRSAVFAPCKDLGMIILDEEQEHSYKSENSPRYTAREIAIWRGCREHGLVLLGSATPSVETMFRAKSGEYKLYKLSHRFNGKPLPAVSIVDMRDEIKQGNDSAISYILQDAIREATDAGNQTVLFLNRRGNSRGLVCVDCSQVPECPRCNARLTYHSANERLMCHYCGYSQSVPATCPDCGGPLKRIGIGTQKIQQDLQDVFPDIQVARMDTDTVSAVNTHEKILDEFSKSGTPVLIGTQMVAKGLNLPKVTLVGVLDADLGLYMNHYCAAETTFNMLTQVVGRAGRGDLGGHAIIQTMLPEHKVITLAANQDYDGFYDLEIGMRRIQQYPPFGDIAHITFFGMDEASVLRGCTVFRDSLRHCLTEPVYCNEKCDILGPAPCPIPKINYNFRYRLTLQCKMSRSLRGLLAHLLRQFSIDRKNRNVSAFIDVNGFD